MNVRPLGEVVPPKQDAACRKVCEKGAPYDMPCVSKKRRTAVLPTREASRCNSGTTNGLRDPASPVVSGGVSLKCKVSALSEAMVCTRGRCR